MIWLRSFSFDTINKMVRNRYEETGDIAGISSMTARILREGAGFGRTLEIVEGDIKRKARWHGPRFPDSALKAIWKRAGKERKRGRPKTRPPHNAA